MIRRFLVLPIAAAMTIWGALEWLPAESLWFDPEVPVFSDVAQGEVPKLSYSRVIKRDSWISYHVILSEVGVSFPVCDPDSPKIQYRANRSGSAVGGDLNRWLGDRRRCEADHLAPGTYQVETTWTVHYPLQALLPKAWQDHIGALRYLVSPKRITRQSPPFTVRPQE